MCGNCTAHREFREAIDKVLDTFVPSEANPRMYDHPYLELLGEIPASLPDGTGIFHPVGWIRWAKRELGYENKQAAD